MRVFEYKSAVSGHLHDVDEIMTHGYWDGPISGICKCQDHYFYYNQTYETWIPFVSTYGQSLEETQKEIDEFNSETYSTTLEEWIEDTDIIRIYGAYYLRPDELKCFVKSHLIWEDASRCIYGTVVGSSDNKDNQKTFKEHLNNLENNKEYQDLKKQGEEIKKEILVPNNKIGWFTIEDFKNIYRRLDKMPKLEQQALRDIIKV